MLDSPDISTSLRDLTAWLEDQWDNTGSILFVTGAGISAESCVPTFRGEEGYWRIGSRNYFPEEMATRVFGFTLTWFILGIAFFPFVWIVSYDGPEDWEAKQAAYYGSPERAAVEPDPAQHIARAEKYFINPVLPGA